MIIYGGVCSHLGPVLAAAPSCSILQTFASFGLGLQEVHSTAVGLSESRARHHPSLMDQPSLFPVLRQAHWYAFTELNTEFTWRLFELPPWLICQKSRWAAVGSRGRSSCSAAVFGCGVEYFTSKMTYWVQEMIWYTVFFPFFSFYFLGTKRRSS